MLRLPQSSFDATPRNKSATAAPDRRDDIPWPVLTKLTPSRLSKTASTLMHEWEKSLAFPAHDSPDTMSQTTSKDHKADQSAAG